MEESAGTVTLVAQVLSGRLSESTVVRLITRDDTAQGMTSLLFSKSRFTKKEPMIHLHTESVSLALVTVFEGNIWAKNKNKDFYV